MGTKIKLTESQIQNLIDKNLTEAQKKGFWKPNWTKDDQILALYNSLYGISKLGYGPKEVAEKVIGTSRDSFIKQTLNFDYLDGRGGLDRPHELQKEVYQEYGKFPEHKLQQICLNIINRELENPSQSVKDYQLGNLIGQKRDDVAQQRLELLKRKGIKNPERFKFQGRRLKEPDPEMASDELEVSTEKNDLFNFLKGMKNKIKNLNKENLENIIPKLQSDIDFILDYIETGLPLSESKIKKAIDDYLLQEELTFDEFHNSPRLEDLRNAINNNKIVGVAFVKSDGSVRAMCFRKYLSSYIPSEREKTEKQQLMNQTHNQISVVDLNVYNKQLRETGDPSLAAKRCWRKITLPNVLGFIAGSTFIDLRGEEDNDILNRFGEVVYNSLTKSMVRAIEQNHAQNVAVAINEL